MKKYFLKSSLLKMCEQWFCQLTWTHTSLTSGYHNYSPWIQISMIGSLGHRPHFIFSDYRRATRQSTPLMSQFSSLYFRLEVSTKEEMDMKAAADVEPLAEWQENQGGDVLVGTLDSEIKICSAVPVHFLTCCGSSSPLRAMSALWT